MLPSVSWIRTSRIQTTRACRRYPLSLGERVRVRASFPPLTF